MLPAQACGALEDETEDSYEGSYHWVVPQKSPHVLGKGDSRQGGGDGETPWMASGKGGEVEEAL